MTKASQANNAFAVDLYRALAGRPGNLLVSPYSVGVALHMTRAGARSQTADEFEKVLHVRGGAGHEGVAALMKALEKVPAEGEKAFELRVANSLWAEKSLDVERDFLAVLRKQYGTDLQRVDFARAAEVARKAINTWVEKETRDRIKDLIQPGMLGADTLLVLVNALYFKAAWANPFQERATKEAPFTRAGGSTVSCRMMHQVEYFRYGDSGDARILEMPYAGGGASMVIVLPREADGLGRIEKKLLAEGIADWLGGLETRDVRVKVPRFGFSSLFELNDPLIAMGLGRAFRVRDADFSGISKGPLFISRVLHKTFIKVDEAGTEAAAATAVIVYRGPPLRGDVEFVADHPFLFFIRNRETGAILFMGRVVEPGG